MRRVAASLGFLCLTLTSLTACGEDDGDDNTGSVEVTGAFGEQPTVTYDGRVARTDTESEVLVEGSGAEVATGDTVFLEIYIGNGFNGQEALTTFEVPAEEPEEEPTDEPTDEPTGDKSDGKDKSKNEDDKGDKDDDGKEDKETDETEEADDTVDQPPFMLQLTDAAPFPGIREALDGVTVGSRVEVLATWEDAFGESGNPAIGIGNRDTVVFVVDVVTRVLDAPEGTEKPLPDGLPSIVESDGKVTGLDFTGTGEPPTNLKVHTVVMGDGPAIKKSGSQVAMRYLGQVWKGEAPFDQNYDAAGPGFPNQSGGIDPAVIPGQLIKGWNEGLVGVTAGSRVLLVAPAKWAYGDQPPEGGDIKAGDTLVFVIDILGVA